LLAGDRHDIGMARQDDAASVRTPDRREQIGFARAGPGERGGDAKAAEIIGDPPDQLEVRARRGRVEGDQPLEDLERRR
jgi:hypothetical protein